MLMSWQQIKDAIARGEATATAEVHAFIAWAEQKDNQVTSAKALLEQNGFTVTPKPAA